MQISKDGKKDEKIRLLKNKLTNNLEPMLEAEHNLNCYK